MDEPALLARVFAKHGEEMRICVSLGRIDVLRLTRRWLLLPLMAAQPSDLSRTRAAIPYDAPGIGVNRLCVHLSDIGSRIFVGISEMADADAQPREILRCVEHS